MPKTLYVLTYALLGLILLFMSMMLVISGVSSFLVVEGLGAVPYWMLMASLWKRLSALKTSQTTSSSPIYF